MYLKKFKNLWLLFFLLFGFVLFSFLIGGYLMNKRIFPFNNDGFLRKIYTQENLEKNEYWANKIKEGGYILYFRHTQREKWDDVVTAYDAHELYNRIEARGSWFERAVCLTSRGLKDAKLIGIVFDHAKIKINKILSSPSCRSRETAIQAFGRIDEFHPAILHASAISNLDYNKMATKLKNLLINVDIKKNENVIISGHGNTLDKYYNLVLDKKNLPPARTISDTNEGGFHILEVDKKNKKIYYKYKFRDFRDFALQVYTLSEIESGTKFPLN